MHIREALGDAQRLFWAVVAVAAVGVYVCVPRWGDRDRLQALGQLEQLEKELDTAALDQRVRQAAERETAPGLQDIARTIAVEGLYGPQDPALQDGLFVARPLGLSTLEAVTLNAPAKNPVAVVGPDLKQLAASLRWRLERRPMRGELTLRDVRVLERTASQEVVDREVQVDPARVAANEAFANWEETRAHYHELRDRSDALRERKAPEQVQRKAAEERREAYLVLEESLKKMRKTRRRYVALARRAGRVKGARGLEGEAAGRMVAATFTRDTGRVMVLRVPVPNTTITQPSVGYAIPATLVELQDGPLWNEVKGESLVAARASLKQTLSWQTGEASLMGIGLRGASVVQWFGVFLCLLLAGLALRARAIVASHDAFQHPGQELPLPGTGRIGLDVTLLIAPACAVVAFALWTMLRMEAPLWIAAAWVVGVPVLGTVAARRWSQALGLRDTLLRTALPPLEVGRKRVIPPPPKPSLLPRVMGRLRRRLRPNIVQGN